MMTRLHDLRLRLAHLAHWAHEPSHLLYLGAVGWEAHGLYAIMAWLCLGVSVVGHMLSYSAPAEML